MFKNALHDLQHMAARTLAILYEFSFSLPLGCMCLFGLFFLGWCACKRSFCLQGDRYDAQRAVIGSKLHDKLQDMQVLVTAYSTRPVHTNALQPALHLSNFGVKQQLSSVEPTFAVV